MGEALGPPDALASSSGPSPPFGIMTWNTLAPNYFRDTVGRRTEADTPAFYLARHGKICDAIALSGADVVCLQEHWFDPKLLALYHERLAPLGYAHEALQRTAWNCDGRSEDGVAILVRKKAFEVVARHDVCFHDYGIPQDRVALLLTLRDVREGVSDIGDMSSATREFAVLCTHLTFPHSRYDVEARRAQICACLQAVQAQLPDSMPLVVAGDLNGPSDDPVGQQLGRAGFRNVWEAVRGQKCAITHLDHRGRHSCTDHVWVRGAMAPASASLLPESTPDATMLERPCIGACARRAAAAPSAVGADAGSDTGAIAPGSFQEWCALSDHRPVLVTLQLSSL